MRPIPLELQPDDAARIADVLRERDYNEVALKRLTGGREFRDFRGSALPELIAALEEAGRLGTVATLLALGEPVAATRLGEAIAPMGIDEWERCGLIRKRRDMFEARVMLVPCGDVLIATDLPTAHIGSVVEDHVMGVGAGTKLLAYVLVDQPRGRVLELGTGCGPVALHAARLHEEVVAVDLLPRAIAYARANALLNGVDNVAFEVGDALATEGQYDVVVAHPPYVISPSTERIYRDTPHHADEGVGLWVRHAASLLKEGGVAQFLVNWVNRDGRDWQQHLGDWFAGTGCDAWVLRASTEEVRSYAEGWLGPAAEHELPMWMAYYERHGVSSITAGMIMLRKRAGANTWHHFVDTPEQMSEGAARHVGRIFDAVTWERSVDDAHLLAAKLRTPDDLAMQQQLSSAGGWSIDDCTTRIVRGLCFEANHDAGAAMLLLGCDGAVPLDDLVGRISARLGRSRADLTRQLLPIARAFLGHGLLLPPETNSA